MTESKIKNQYPNNFLDFLPYRVTFYDNNLKLAYSNHMPDGSFFPEEDADLLPDWVWQALDNSTHKSLHVQIPTESFDKLMLQSYQALYDKDNILQGVYSYIQDLKPILASYLEESGQAIVGWSDVTSGASIKNDQFDNLD
jgi:hypothetical protein